MHRYKFIAPTSQAPQPINSRGFYIRYEKATAGQLQPGIIIKTNKEDEFPLMPGQGMHVGHDVERWEIVNEAASAEITGYVVIGGIEAMLHDGRISGEVLSVSGEYLRSLAANCFTYGSSAGPSPGNYPYCQLWNPANSGVDCIVTKVTFSRGSSDATYIGINAGAVGGGIVCKNKLAGGSDSSVLFVSAVSANNPAVASVFYAHPLANTSQEYLGARDQPIILPPGYGLYIAGATANTNITEGRFDFIERSYASR